MAQLKAHNDFLPPPTPGLQRSLVLALVVHALLVIALAYVVPWHLENSDSPPFTAELWTALPSAAPKSKAPITPPEPTPAPPPPAPAPPVEKSAKPVKPVPKVAAPVVQSPKADADIALKAQKQKPDTNAEDITKQVKNKASTAQDDKPHKETETPKPSDDKARKELEAVKAAQEKLRKELEATKATEDKQRKELEAAKAREDNQRKELEAAKTAQEKQRKESELAKAELEKRRKEEADKAEQEKRQKAADAAKKLEADRKREEQAQSDKLRKDQLERTMKQVPGTGTGTQNGPPSAEYGAKVRAAIRPNLSLIREVSPNLTAEYLVQTGATGNIISAKLAKSSGDAYWDDVALKAIWKTDRLPPDKDGKVPSPMLIVVSP